MPGNRYYVPILNFHIQSYEDGTYIAYTQQVNSIIFYTHDDVDFQMPMNFPVYVLFGYITIMKGPRRCNHIMCRSMNILLKFISHWVSEEQHK